MTLANPPKAFILLATLICVTTNMTNLDVVVYGYRKP